MGTGTKEPKNDACVIRTDGDYYVRCGGRIGEWKECGSGGTEGKKGGLARCGMGKK